MFAPPRQRLQVGGGGVFCAFSHILPICSLAGSSDSLLDETRQNSGNVSWSRDAIDFSRDATPSHPHPHLTGLVAATLRNVQYHCARLRVDTSHHPSLRSLAVRLIRCRSKVIFIYSHLLRAPLGTCVSSAQYLPISHHCQMRVLSPALTGVLGGHG